jgi:Na+-translocating ferredoxin:NAD+ oxidoreductase RnfC subunit
MRAAGIKYVQAHEPRVHPIKDGRRVPLLQLRRRLKVEDYESETPYDASELSPRKVRILLKQHAGKSASPRVGVGDVVKRGQLVGSVGESDLGASIHASIDGRVEAVSEEAVTITA